MSVIYEDTRQQDGKHEQKHRWFNAHGVELVRKKLDFGDYMAEGSNISIDTKQGIGEICQNVTRDHARFIREIERAETNGYRLVFLIEQGRPYNELVDIARWCSEVCIRCQHRRTGVCDMSSAKCIRFRRKPVQGRTVLKIMRSIMESHGCVFELVPPSMSAKRICELLGVMVDG